MGSRKAVLSAQRLLDMVPLGDDLQGGSNQGVKAYSDTSDRYIFGSGTLKGARMVGDKTYAWVLSHHV